MNAINQAVKPAAERAPSYYSASLNFESDYPTLQGSVTVDVAIIGGGFTGIATAGETRLLRQVVRAEQERHELSAEAAQAVLDGLDATDYSTPFVGADA